MNRYFTILIIPERVKGVKSFRIPRVFFHGFVFLLVVSMFIVGVLGYDYVKILRQMSEKKHLSIENRQLKEQIQLFQMKLNTLSDDIERIHRFEKKLRIITGVESLNKTISTSDEDRLLTPYSPSYQPNNTKANSNNKNRKPNSKDTLKESNDLNKNYRSTEIKNLPEYKKLKSLYEKKIAANLGLQTGYVYTQKWSQLLKQSFSMADHFAGFDFRFNIIREHAKKLEISIHQLDQFLLDKDSFMKSTPTLLPTRGWITSYYGHRKSPYSGRVKMHEGIDIGAKSGSPITAPADGIVVFTGRKPGFGIKVQLDHGYGVETIFAHAKASTVHKGQNVRRGDIIAQVGNTGYSTGPHLHYEIRINGIPVDPLDYILD